MGFFDKVSDAIITAEMVFEKECRSFTCYGLEDITKNVEIKGKIIDKDNNLIQFSGNILVETKSLYGKKFLIDDQNQNHGARPGFGGDQDGRGPAENQDRTGRNIHRKIQLPQTGIDLKRHIAARTRHMENSAWRRSPRQNALFFSLIYVYFLSPVSRGTPPSKP